MHAKVNVSQLASVREARERGRSNIVIDAAHAGAEASERASMHREARRTAKSSALQAGNAAYAATSQLCRDGRGKDEQRRGEANRMLVEAEASDGMGNEGGAHTHAADNLRYRILGTLVFPASCGFSSAG